jgi:hypothetical protein
MRKALIIGLGGTGVEICNWLAERLRWEFGDLKRVSWVDFYCLDTSTDKVRGTVLDNPNNFHHATISAQTFRQMREAPKDFDSHNNFSQWYNPEVMGIQNAVEDGTTGLRMLGRMALLLPQNWNRVFDTVSRKVRDLVALTPGEAQDRFGSRFDETATTISFPNRVTAYVLGTGCGGSGSSAHLLMGYLLRQLKAERFPEALSTVGILTLPAAAEEHHERKANAYATLVELNHFSTDYNEYYDKYPNLPQPVRVYNYPYDFPYLVTAESRADLGGLRDFNELNCTVAQYLHSDLLFDVAEVRDGRRNNVTRHFISSDRRGMSQRFMTFGVSFIQYPVERIMRGCTYKLLTHTFDRWLLEHEERVPANVASVLKLSPDELYRRLCQTGQGSLAERVDAMVQNLVESYAGLEDIEALHAQLRAALSPPAEGAAPQIGRASCRERV